MRVTEVVDSDPEILSITLRQSEINILTAILGNTCGAGENAKRAAAMYDILEDYAVDYDKIVKGIRIITIYDK